MMNQPESPPGSPEDKGTPKERNFLQRLLKFQKQRLTSEQMSKEAQQEFLETRRQVGKPHVPTPPSKN